jgi:hypothetical protein
MTQREFMIAIWLLAIYTAGVAYLVYGLQVKQAGGGRWIRTPGPGSKGRRFRLCGTRDALHPRR